MKITTKESINEQIRDVALTVTVIAGTVLAVGMVPKVFKGTEAIIGSISADATFKMADAVRALSLAKTYDIKAAKEAMLALPRILAK